MNKKLYMLPTITVLFLFLSLAAFWVIIAEAEGTDTGLIDSGACGKMHYNLDEDDDDEYLSFKADKSVKYKLYKDGTMVISGTGEMGNFNTWLFEDDFWYKRKELIPWYDYRSDIKKVVVKKGVTSIGSATFYGCKNLESIQWTDSIKKVGDSAFYKCSSLKNVKLPSHVKEWGDFVFAECKGLKKVSMDADFRFHLYYVEEEESIYVEELAPIVWASDGIGMFSGCTSLEEVRLPKAIRAIPSRFVEGCTSLKTFPIPDKVNFWGSCPPSLCKGKYVLPDSVRLIGDGGFAGCSNMEELILPEGIVYIGTAFEGCSNLKTLKIPKSVRELWQTFYNCIGLESIVIPKSVKKLEASVFEGCSNLKSVVLPKNMEYIDDNFFKNCTSLKKIKMPLKLAEIRDGAFDGCSALTDIEIPKTVKYIRRYVFSDCISLKEIDIPKGVVLLSRETFYNCKNLKSITIRAKNQIAFGEKVFYGCEKLSKITLYAEDLAYWTDKHAFDGIPKGVSIYVPKGRVNKFKKQFKKSKIDMSNIDIREMK